jgi:hypothetical protein
MIESSNHEIQDHVLLLLNQQFCGVNSSLQVCKWPVTLTTCFFLITLCWDMAGDKTAGSQAPWVVVVGVVMMMVIWLCDRIFTHGISSLNQSWPQHSPFLLFSNSPLRPTDHDSSSTNRPTVEFVRSSLHGLPAHRVSLPISSQESRPSGFKQI